MTSSVVFSLCLAAFVGSGSAVRRTEVDGASTCCCFSDAGDCASKKSKQGQNIDIPSGAATYCCKLRKGGGCEYHKKKYGTPLAEILGETATVHDGMCTFDVAAPPESIPDEELPKPPVEEPKDLNDPVPPVEDAADETEDESRSPAGYGAVGETSSPTPVDEVKHGNEPVPQVEGVADETEGAAGEKTPATPAEELEDVNDPAPPVEQDTAAVETEDDGDAEPGNGAAAARVTDLTGFMQNKKERTVDGTTYTCCCSVQDSSLLCEILDVNTADKAISWKGGCGGLKGNGWHSYKNMGSKYASVPNIGDCRVETNELAEKLLIGHLMQ